MPELASSTLPRHFGRYTLFDFIGKGGMAEIYLARTQTELGGSRLSVIKQIIPTIATNARFAEMFTFEAKLSAQLTHANIVQVFDLGRADDRLFIAMEYVEGFDLNDLLRRCSKQKTPLPLEFALHIATSTLRGLDYAHRREGDNGMPLGIVHRDVSPSNVLVSVEGEVKLCDFGIAHANEAVVDAAHSHDELIKGKAGYMSPEHARGESIDARSDVFSAGVLLWELMAGRRMYRAQESGPSLLDLAREANTLELPDRGLQGHDAIKIVVQKALERDPNDRYASAHEMLLALESHMMSERILANPLRFGEWLIEHFGSEIIEQRRARERAVMALEHAGIVVEITPVGSVADLEEDVPLSTSVSVPPLAQENEVEENLAPSAMAVSPPGPSKGLWFAVALVLIVVLALAFGWR